MLSVNTTRNPQIRDFVSAYYSIERDKPHLYHDVLVNHTLYGITDIEVWGNTVYYRRMEMLGCIDRDPIIYRCPFIRYTGRIPVYWKALLKQEAHGQDVYGTTIPLFNGADLMIPHDNVSFSQRLALSGVPIEQTVPPYR